MNELLDVELPDEEWDTVGGLVFNTARPRPQRGRVPSPSTASSSAPSASQGRRIVSVRDHAVSSTRRSAEAQQLPDARGATPDGVPVRDSSRSSAARTSGSRRWCNQIVGAEGLDRLRPAADDAHASARRPHDRRDADRVPRHARHAQAAHAARRTVQRTSAGDAGRGRRRLLPDRGQRRDRAGRPLRRGAHRRGAPRRRCSSSTRSTSRRTARSASSSPASRPSSATSRHTCRSRRAPATGSTRCSASSNRGCPRARTTTRTGVVSDQPESFLAAELVREQLLAIARDELPHSIAVTTEEVEERETACGAAPRAARGRSRRARVPEGHRDRQGRRGAQSRGHRRPPRARGAARDARPSRDAREGRPRLAAPAHVARPPRACSDRELVCL